MSYERHRELALEYQAAGNFHAANAHFFAANAHKLGQISPTHAALAAQATTIAMDAGFEEGKHPRADNGQFGEGHGAAAEHHKGEFKKSNNNRDDKSATAHREAAQAHEEAKVAYTHPSPTRPQGASTEKAMKASEAAGGLPSHISEKFGSGGVKPAKSEASSRGEEFAKKIIAGGSGKDNLLATAKAHRDDAEKLRGGIKSGSTSGSRQSYQNHVDYNEAVAHHLEEHAAKHEPAAKSGENTTDRYIDHQKRPGVKIKNPNYVETEKSAATYTPDPKRAGKMDKTSGPSEIHRAGKFSVRHDPVRKKKGLPSYAVFEDGNAKAHSAHHDEAEAKAAAEKHHSESATPKYLHGEAAKNAQAKNWNK